MNTTTQETTYKQTSFCSKSFQTLLKYYFTLCRQLRDEGKVPVNPNRNNFYDKYNKDVPLFIREASLAYVGLHSVMCIDTITPEGVKINQLVLAYKTRIILSFDKEQGLVFILKTKDLPCKQGQVLAYLVKQGYNVTCGESLSYMHSMYLHLGF